MYRGYFNVAADITAGHDVQIYINDLRYIETQQTTYWQKESTMHASEY